MRRRRARRRDDTIHTMSWHVRDIDRERVKEAREAKMAPEMNEIRVPLGIRYGRKTRSEDGVTMSGEPVS